jgi:hypothetical protein
MFKYIDEELDLLWRAVGVVEGNRGRSMLKRSYMAPIHTKIEFISV